MFSIKFLSNVGSVSFRMLVISSLKFLIFKTKFLFILIAFKINSSLKDSSLVIKTQLLTCSDFQQSDAGKCCSILFIVFSLSEALLVLFGSSELICSSVKLLSVSL